MENMRSPGRVCTEGGTKGPRGNSGECRHTGTGRGSESARHRYGGEAGGRGKGSLDVEPRTMPGAQQLLVKLESDRETSPSLQEACALGGRAGEGEAGATDGAIRGQEEQRCAAASQRCLGDREEWMVGSGVQAEAVAGAPVVGRPMRVRGGGLEDVDPGAVGMRAWGSVGRPGGGVGAESGV